MKCGSTSAEALACRTAQELAVHHFIKRWNTGEGSLISDLTDLDMAFTFEAEVVTAWDAALFEAESHGIQDEFRAAFSALVQPVIDETFASGLRNLCEDWARNIAGASPTRHGLETPFREVNDWIAWCLTHVEWPPFARPWGEVLIPDEQAEPLIRRALLRNHELATDRGWITNNPEPQPPATRH